MKHLSTDIEKSTERPKVVASEIGMVEQGKKLGNHSQLRKKIGGERVNSISEKVKKEHTPVQERRIRRRSKFVHEIRIEESRTAY